MAITTLDGVIAGCKPTSFFSKYTVGVNPFQGGRPVSTLYLGGIPGPAVVPTPGVAGVALTSYAGQLPFTNPGTGENTYLARFVAMSPGVVGTVILADRLWHNSGLANNTNLSQNVNSVAWPARDQDESTNGRGVYIGIEYTTGTGVNPTITLGYTNSAGTASKTANQIPLTLGGNLANFFFPFALANGDVGVRSIQTIQFSAAPTGAVFSLVAFRPIAVLPVAAAGSSPSAIDALTSGFPRMWNNTVPFLIFLPGNTPGTFLQGQFAVTQG
jgi:hypothetical protein